MTEDERKLCPTCKLPLVPQQGSSPAASVCEAGHRLVHVALEGHALGTGSLGLYATSNQRIGELPAREEVRYQRGGDLQGSFKLDRTDANPKIEQTAEHSYRSTREFTEQEEVEAVMRLLPQYNSVHKVNYESPMKEHQDSAIDVVAKDSRTGSRLSLQVRKADTRPWHRLARSSRYDIQQTEVEIHEELWRGIDDKRGHYGDCSGIILVLDGWPPIAPGVLETFLNAYHDKLAAAGFQEIWYVPRYSGEPKRLSPR